MPSFGGEVKPSVPCCRFAACKRSVQLPWKSNSVGKTGSAISRPYFLPLLIDVCHVAGRGAPLEITGGTKSGAQRARSYGLGASGLQGPGSAPYSTLLSLSLHFTSGFYKCSLTESFVTASSTVIIDLMIHYIFLSTCICLRRRLLRVTLEISRTVINLAYRDTVTSQRGH
jgi:hypothetical protein